jgi:hypothetical protein
MSKYARKQEVQVIDDKLLIEGLAGNKNIPPPDRRGDQNLVDMCPLATSLILSFKNIGKIENLIGFERITKLCLDNNQIKEIINLDSLVNLKWLDLSFNSIQKIQGLKNLKALEDLSLYSNNISVIEGLEFCTSLQCLSLGNNKIDSLEQVIKLRQLRSLRMLTFTGNPICGETEYNMTVLAYVDGLKYLDYALVDEADVTVAKEQYHDELLDIEEKESVVAEKVSRDKAMSDFLKQLDEAGVIFAHVLFDDMFADDPDLEKLKHLPGTKELVENFRGSFKSLSDEFIKAAMEKFEKKNKECADFNKVIKTIRQKADTESVALIENFNKSKKNVVSVLRSSDVASVSTIDKDAMIKSLQKELDNVGDELMSIEMRQVEKYEVLVDEFDNRMNDLKNMCLEMQQLFFRAVEDLEDKFSGNIRGVATDLIDRLAKEELAEDYLDDEAMSLVVDKDSCMGTLSGSHDLHIGKILKREDEARSTETRRYQEMLFKYNSSEKTRNRDRIIQIHEFTKTSLNSIAKLLALDEDEADDNDAHL